MRFTVLIPARLASMRLPNKPLADIGGAPMVVRVAQRAQRSKAENVVVATDSHEIMSECTRFGIQAVMTSAAHASGSDRLAEACALLGLPDDAVVLNVQGDEPLIDVELINAVAHLLVERPECAISTAAHAIESIVDYLNPNIVKVVLDARQNAMYFSRAPIPSARGDAAAELPTRVQPLRHVGLYGYRAGFLKAFPLLAAAPVELLEGLEQLRALWHGYKIAVHITQQPPGIGVDTAADLEAAREQFATLEKSRVNPL